MKTMLLTGTLLIVLVLILLPENNQSTPEPTPTPDDSAIDLAIADSIYAGNEAVRSDTQTAHATPTPEPTPVPSNEVQMGRAWGVPGAIALVGMCAFSALALVAILFILAWDRRTTLLAQMDLGELKCALEWFKEQRAGGDSCPTPPTGVQ